VRYALTRDLLAVLAVIFVDLWWGGPLSRIDVRLAAYAIGRDSTLRTLLLIPDGFGLRAVTAPLLVLTASALGWRARSWRPTTLSLIAIVALNVTVGIMKIAVGRGKPIDHAPDLFVGGMMWPSGHASNIAMTAAVGLYLVRRYSGWQLSVKAEALIFVVPTAVMCITSLVCGYHWLSDLIAGVIVGLLVAIGVTVVDDQTRVRPPPPSLEVTPETEPRSAAPDAGKRSAMV
jgi:membrane-associated phospholipid phosphatase